MAGMACSLMTIIDWLSCIPATFWGVLAGSVFSLSGVVLANRNSAKNLRAQLEHDRATRAKEREMSMRKDIYLAAAEAIAAGMQALGRMANVNTQREALDDFNKLAPAIAKVYVIGRIETIDAVVTVQSELTSGFLRMQRYVMPVTILKTQVAALSSRIDSFSAAQKGLLEQIAEERLRGAPDHPKWEELQRQFKFETDRLNEVFPEKAALDRKFADAQLSLSLGAINETEKVNRVLPAAVAAIRDELELHLDQDAFRAILQRNFEQQRQIFAQLLSEAQELISKANSPPPAPLRPPGGTAAT